MLGCMRARQHVRVTFCASLVASCALHVGPVTTRWFSYVHKKLSCVLCKAVDVKAAEVKKDSFATRSSKRCPPPIPSYPKP